MCSMKMIKPCERLVQCDCSKRNSKLTLETLNSKGRLKKVSPVLLSFRLQLVGTLIHGTFTISHCNRIEAPLLLK